MSDVSFLDPEAAAKVVLEYRARIRAACEAHSLIIAGQTETLTELHEHRVDAVRPFTLAQIQGRNAVHFRALRRRLRKSGQARFQCLDLGHREASQRQYLGVEEIQSEGEFGVVHGGELLADDPAMTATTASSPHRLSETPE